MRTKGMSGSPMFVNLTLKQMKSEIRNKLTNWKIGTEHILRVIVMH